MAFTPHPYTSVGGLPGVPEFSHLFAIELFQAEAIPEALLEQIVTIFLECFTAAPRYECWEHGQVRAMLHALVMDGATCSIAIQNNDVAAGFALGLPAGSSKIFANLNHCGVSAEDYYLDQLAISPRHQGLGLGRSLLTHQIVACRAHYARMAVRCRADVQPIKNLLLSEDFHIIASYLADTANSGMAERLVLQKQLVAVA